MRLPAFQIITESPVYTSSHGDSALLALCMAHNSSDVRWAVSQITETLFVWPKKGKIAKISLVLCEKKHRRLLQWVRKAWRRIWIHRTQRICRSHGQLTDLRSIELWITTWNQFKSLSKWCEIICNYDYIFHEYLVFHVWSSPWISISTKKTNSCFR